MSDSEDVDSPDIVDVPKKPKTKTVKRKEQIIIDSRWTTNEKKQLFAALTKHGSADIKILASSVPSKNEEQIKYFISQCKKHARDSLKEEKNEDEKEAPIDEWLDYIIKLNKNDSQRLLDLSRAYKYMSLFEPTDSDSATSDCYSVIASCLRGEAPKHITPQSSMFLVENIQKLAKLVKTDINMDEKRLARAVLSKKPPKCYPSKNKNPAPVSSSSESAESINPLNIPKNFLQCKSDDLSFNY